MKWVRRVLHFKKPVIYHLDYLDVVIEDKMLLLVSWKFRHVYKLSIAKTKLHYRKREGAVIVKIPAGSNSIQLLISTFWRKKIYTIALKKTKLDAVTAQHVLQQLKVLQLPGILINELKIRNDDLPVQIPMPSLKPIRLSLKELHLSVTNNQLIFTN